MVKTIKEMIKVMEHYVNGGEVEFITKEYNIGARWETVTLPSWDWSNFDYRIKQLKQKVTIEKWLIEDKNSIKVVVETSDINPWLKSFPTAQKLKLIESYEVEI